MGFAVTSTLLAFALIAGDPDMEWSDNAAAPASVPTPSAPPPLSPAQTMPSIEAPTPTQPPPGAEPLDSVWRVTIEVDVGISPSSMGKMGLGLELGWVPFRYVKLHTLVSGGWVPASTFQGFSNGGELRLLFGVDGLIPFVWGELFAGIESGTAFSNVQAQGYYGGGTYEWSFAPSLRLRGGFDVTKLRPIVVGADLSYALFTRGWNGEVHWLELHGRVGIAF